LAALKAVREARHLRQRVDRGENPLEDRASPSGAATVASLLDDFVIRHVRNRNQPLRSADEYESAFKRLVKPRIGKLGIYEVRRSHVIKMLDEIEDANGPVMADRTLAYVRKAFNWYATRDDQFNVPVVRGMGRVKPKERARTRVLSDEEIRTIWPVLEETGTYGSFVKMLLLTAQRHSEVARMSHIEIDADGIWTIPAERYKTKRPKLTVWLLRRCKTTLATICSGHGLSEPTSPSIVGTAWFVLLTRSRTWWQVWPPWKPQRPELPVMCLRKPGHQVELGYYLRTI
jgi:integrase